jgi:glycosyltransferase involved in cell wall biosynthesis
VRLAWFTPLPPMPSGIADYSTELLPLVADQAGVDVYCPRLPHYRRVKAPPGLTVQKPSAFGERDDARAYDAVFYHLGNNPFHEFVYDTALARPGIVVFHDFVLHHLIAHLTVEVNRRRPRYQSLLQAEYGGDAGKRLSDLRFNGVANEFEKFLFPLNEHVARTARAIVVHSEDSADRIRDVAPDVPVSVIPHHAGAPPASVAGIDRAVARARLGLPANGFVVGHFGFITRPKQPGAVLGGFARLARERADALLVMVGQDTTGGGLGRQVGRLGLAERVRVAGFVDLERFYLYLKAVDAVINLRYPSAGESSGTFARAMAEGRATIVNDYGSFAEIPPDVAMKVEIDGDQTREVGEHLVHLATDPVFKASIEARARGYATTTLDPVRCRDLYLEVARAV